VLLKGMRVRAEDQAREAERRRIAREMHDVLAHRLSILSVHAGALEHAGDALPPAYVEAAGLIRNSARLALEELRASCPPDACASGQVASRWPCDDRAILRPCWSASATPGANGFSKRERPGTGDPFYDDASGGIAWRETSGSRHVLL
jgi:hypothetical protein